MTFEMPEDSLTTSHPARLLWNMLGGFDLSAFSAEVTSVAGDAGRPQLSPRMMLTLWLFGIVEGIGSARRIARPTQRDTAYRWIVGDLHVSLVRGTAKVTCVVLMGAIATNLTQFAGALLC